MRSVLILASAVLLAAAAAPAKAPPAKPPAKTRPAAEILAGSPAGDWRTLDQGNLLYIQLPKGRVIIELAPTFAPNHVANIKTLARAGWFDGIAVVRVQDNFVTQWGDPTEKKPLGEAKPRLAPEFTRPLAGLAFQRLPERDAYAAEVGFVGGMPAAADRKAGRAWLAHCYGMVGVGRENAADSGNGAELYAVNGHAPRNLDRNLTVVGRVVQGMELLSALPRGTGSLGFYEKPEERIPIGRVRLGSDLPDSERLPLQALRTDSRTFAELTEARRNRRDDFYTVPAGGVDLCNVNLPVRKTG